MSPQTSEPEKHQRPGPKPDCDNRNLSISLNRLESNSQLQLSSYSPLLYPCAYVLPLVLQEFNIYSLSPDACPKFLQKYLAFLLRS